MGMPWESPCGSDPFPRGVGWVAVVIAILDRAHGRPAAHYPSRRMTDRAKPCHPHHEAENGRVSSMVAPCENGGITRTAVPGGAVMLHDTDYQPFDPLLARSLDTPLPATSLAIW